MTYILCFKMRIKLRPRGSIIMFKIDKEEKVTKTFRISKSFYDKLSTIAQEEGVSVNNLIVQCCEYALEDFEKKENYVAEE